MKEFICPNCNKSTFKHAKGLCITCYKKLTWKPKLVTCKRCKRNLPHHSKGLCTSCYNSVFRIDYIKSANYKKWYGLDTESYKKLTKECVLCGFDKIVELHHLDRDTKNSDEKNLIGLCPNHHRMLHNRSFHEEVIQALKQKGFDCKIHFQPDSDFH